MTTLRLILGDQLNCQHSWYQQVRDDVVYVMMEVRQETDYVMHHAQKIIAIFAAMRDFAARLRADGHTVHYLAIDDAGNQQALPANLDLLIARYQADAFHWQAPDEWRLDQQLRDYASGLPIASAMAAHAVPNFTIIILSLNPDPAISAVVTRTCVPWLDALNNTYFNLAF